MVDLPSPAKVASLVSQITETMFSISFEAIVPSEPPPSLHWRTVLLPIPGEHPITILLSSDRKGCERLASAMFMTPVESIDAGMLDDALCELANMTAGLLKNTLRLDQALGLPAVIPRGIRARPRCAPRESTAPSCGPRRSGS